MFYLNVPWLFEQLSGKADDDLGLDIDGLTDDPELRGSLNIFIQSKI